MNGARPFASVIIPVYCPAGEGGDALLECLEHLSQQTYPRERFEVIIAENGCPPLESVLARLAEKYSPPPDIRVVRESRPGSYAARNAALRVAKGEVIAFTDGDCLPHPDWLERAVESVGEAKETGIVAGAITIVSPRPAGVSPLAYLYSATLSFTGRNQTTGSGKKTAPKPTFGATANLTVRRSIIDAVGPFDAEFLSGGDWEWGFRADALGYQTRYEAAVRVGHQARPTVRSILRREMRLAGGNQKHRELHGPKGKWGILRDIFRVELKYNPRWAIHVIRHARLEELKSKSMKARMGALLFLVYGLRAIERLRVFTGGAARRS